MLIDEQRNILFSLWQFQLLITRAFYESSEQHISKDTASVDTFYVPFVPYVNATTFRVVNNRTITPITRLFCPLGIFRYHIDSCGLRRETAVRRAELKAPKKWGNQKAGRKGTSENGCSMKIQQLLQFKSANTKPPPLNERCMKTNARLPYSSLTSLKN